MTVQAYPKPRLSPRAKPRANLKPECVETVQLQEQFTGPLPLRNERPAAELLAERLAESGASGPVQLFIP
jgi:hypothetical protein